MTAADALAALRRLGADIVLSTDSVRLSAPRTVVLPDELITTAKARKSEIRLLLVQEVRERFEELSAISEYDGGLSRRHAETLSALSTMPAPSGITPEQMRAMLDAAARFLAASA